MYDRYILSRKYGFLPKPDRPAKRHHLTKLGGPVIQTGEEYIIDKDTDPPGEDSFFVNEVLVRIYQDSKRGNSIY